MDEYVTPSRLGPEQLLGELEAAIMQVIWREGEVTVREIWIALQPERALAYTTIMTVMSRLADKRVLAKRKQGKTYYYRAVGTRDEFVTQRAERAVRDVLASFGDAAMALFLRELDAVDQERLAALRDLAAEERSGVG